MGIRVLIADAQPLLAECLAIALGQWDELDPIDDRTAYGPDVVAAIHRRRPDVALVDYWMPGVNGPGISSEILAEVEGFKVIFLSWFYADFPWFDAPGDIERALEAGAVGFLPKHCRVEVVAEAVRRAHEGERPVLADAVRALIERMRTRREQADEMWQRLSLLTRREIQILEYLSYGVTVQGAAEALYISPATVRTHVQRILQKTGTHSQAAAIAMARTYGVISA